METYKNLAEIFALGAAGAFFIYKLFTGYFVSNLSISIECFRQSNMDGESDFLSVTATLDKGDRGSINLHDAQVRATWPNGELTESLIGLNRLSFKTNNVGNYKVKLVNWRTLSSKFPVLRLTPGEKSHFSCYIAIPTNVPCTVEVIVLGKKPKSWLVGQWRASTTSLPIKHTDNG